MKICYILCLLTVLSSCYSRPQSITEAETSEVIDQHVTTSCPETVNYETQITSETTVKTTASTTPSSQTSPATNYLSLTDSERKIFATVLQLECGNQSYECQLAVASVIVNRMNYHSKSLRDVIYEKGQFAVAYLIDKETGNSNYPPDDTNWKVVDAICKNGSNLPYYVMYFRSDYYHPWTTPYCNLGDMYFSYLKTDIN